MMKHLLSASLIFLGLNVFSQSFVAMYDFSSVSSSTAANTGTTDPTPPPIVPGITFGSFIAVGTPTSTSASGVFAFSGWDIGVAGGNDNYSTYTASISNGKYYQVTVTPSGSLVTLTSITFNMSRSSTGPRTWVVRSDRDAYTNNLPATVSGNTNINVQATNVFFWALDSYTVSSGKQEAGSTITLSGPNYVNQTAPFTFRWYPYNAESGAGTFRIDTVRFNGTTSGGAGLAEYTQDINSTIKIYPNPSNDGVIYLDTKKINYNKIEVVNILGSVVAIENKEAVKTEKIKLDLNTLPSGTYFVRVTSGSKVYSERFFIAK
jgi:hypothetical protein